MNSSEKCSRELFLLGWVFFAVESLSLKNYAIARNPKILDFSVIGNGEQVAIFLQ